jgi:hypothetical protein
MSEEELQLLITLDDPGDELEEDTFNHLQAKNTLEYWLGQRCQLDQRAKASSDNDASR